MTYTVRRTFSPTPDLQIVILESGQHELLAEAHYTSKSDGSFCIWSQGLLVRVDEAEVERVSDEHLDQIIQKIGEEVLKHQDELILLTFAIAMAQLEEEERDNDK